MDKKASRQRRATKTRQLIRQLAACRLSVHRTPRHIYAQIFSQDGDRVLASASTLDLEVKNLLDGAPTGNVDAAVVVGKVIGSKAVNAGIATVAFDRSGFKYHGRVKALADAAREAGLQF